MLAIWLSIYSGLFQLVLGVLRLGRIADLVSQPVIHGFINAAALIIIFSQLPDLFGLRDIPFVKLWDAVTVAGKDLPANVVLSSFFGVCAGILLILLKRYVPKLPGMLFVCVIAILSSWWIGLAEYSGAVVGVLPSGLPTVSLPPPISFHQHQALWPPAFILALVSFTEAMSSCRTLAKKQQTPWEENQELIGQGMAKIASGICGAFPVSGSFSRSALNLYAGAISAWSTIFSAGCVVLALVFLLDVISYLPKAVLAAMIIIPTYALIDLGRFRKLIKVAKDDAIVAIATFVITLISMPYLHWGVFGGIGLGMVFFLYRRSHPRLIEVALHEDGTLRDRHRFNLPQFARDTVAIRMDSALNFLTANPFDRFVTQRCANDPGIRKLLVCASGLNDIDATGLETFETLHVNLAARGIELYVSAAKKQVLDVFEESGLVSRIGRDKFIPTDYQAYKALHLG